VSGFINARGDIIQSLGWETRGVLTQSVEVREEITTYVTYGDWVGRMSLLVALLGVFVLLIRRRVEPESFRK
jgi:apolipoprotein N-acyltransferase